MHAKIVQIVIVAMCALIVQIALNVNFVQNVIIAMIVVVYISIYVSNVKMKLKNGHPNQ